MGLSTNWRVPISQVLPDKFAYTSIDKLDSGQVKITCNGNNINDDVLQARVENVKPELHKPKKKTRKTFGSRRKLTRVLIKSISKL